MSEIISKLSVSPSFRKRRAASDEQIAVAEKTLGLSFNSEYREYLSEYGAASVYGHEFTGICAAARLNVVDVTVSEREYNPQIPMDWYVLEQAHIDDIVIWQSGSGEVYQANPDSQPFKLCNSFSEYIDL